MNEEINWKSIIFYSIFLILTIILIELFVQPMNYVKLDFVKDFFRKITVSQNIAPQRLFINAWRTTKNSYIDETLNNQDWSYWRRRYFKHIKTIDDANVAINSMLASLNDPYSKFLLSNSFAKQKVLLDSKITGVGILFDKTGNDIVINHVIANSSAYAANIKVGDAIVGINGKDAKNIDMEKIVAELGSGKTKKVLVTVKRGDVLITKELTKKDIFFSTMSYKITKDNIGIVTLSNVMGQKAVEDFKRILIATNNTKGLIIDLRNNYGGILANAIQMANFMMNENEIVRVKSRVNREYQIYSENDKVFKEKPVVILVNDKTASAAEILAGTLQVNIGAVIVGENTFGKNAIQLVIPMSNGTGLVITTDKYILPDGRDIYKIGVEPDIVVEKSLITSKKDKQMEKAKKIVNEMVKKKK